ncbi:MAG: glycoside hydrolase family 3 C-terminal domain-containing protein [Bacteroidales bacterium]|nr:glycoside hydrolase family 3 C-terminal domain-containing protein [Bacteroidales bacterium]
MKKRLCKQGLSFLFCLAVIVFIGGCKGKIQKSLYLDTSYSFEERAADLVSRFTIEEKQSLLGNTMAAVPRLGVNTYYVWGEALHGVVPMFNPYAGQATSFPNSVAMGSSWDPALMERETSIISDEARAFNNPVIANLTFWSPVVEPVRDPRWGRTGESFGEDPFLISQIGGGFVRGLMGSDPVYLKAVPCGKHYFANNSEFNRHVGSSDMDDRDMREYYLSQYRKLIEKDKLPSIMTCYNAVNGIPMSANKYLVDTIARKTYGLYGYITGDCGAIQDIQTGHLYVKTGAEATALGLKSGVDTDCGSIYQTSAIDALSKGLITEADIDRALVNMFTVRMRIGEFDPPSKVPYSAIDSTVVNSPDHVTFAAEVAKKTPVLLKNINKKDSDRKILPLNASELRKIALIGPQADKVELGPYSGMPPDKNRVIPLSGIKSFLSAKGSTTEVVYKEGANTVNNSNLFNVNYFEIVKNDGSSARFDATKFMASSKGIAIGTGALPIPSLKNIGDGSWTSYKNVNVSNMESININLSIPGDGGSIEVRKDSPAGALLASFDIKPPQGRYGGFMPSLINAKTTGKGVSGNQTLCLVYRAPAKQPIDKEVTDLAASSDVVILFVGTDDKTANEEADRLSLVLPGNQYELINAVAAVNPNTVVVMQTLGMVEVDQFKDNPNVAGIIWTGFNGQAQGTAMANILFGDVNPGGKLNATWYKSVNDLPPITDYNLRAGKDRNGRTYWYFNKDVSYEFGYGLSYTTFEYSNFIISNNAITPNDRVTVSTDVKNTGSVDGDEVIQIYVKTPDSPASLERPIKRLKGFQRVTIPAGQTKTVSIEIDCADLWFWDGANDRIMFDQGKYIFEIGSSSIDIRGTVEAAMNGEYTPVLNTVVAECDRVVLKPGNTVQTSVSASLSDDSFYNLKDAKVTYRSNNPDVAGVNENGLVTAIAQGVATIIAEVTINGVTKSDSYPLKVMADLTLTSIEMNGQKLENFSPDVRAYSYLTEDFSAKPPQITAQPSVPETTLKITQANAIPGTALITLTDNVTGQTGIYAVNFGTPSIGDNFLSDSIREKWSWVREDPANWSLTETERYLTITAQEGDIKGSANNAKNILLQSANTDWVIESRLEFSKRPSRPDQQGGIIAYQDDDNYVKLVYTNSTKGFMGGDELIELLIETQGSQYSAANVKTLGLVPDDLAIVFRLEKKGSRYTAWYATGGGDFVLLGSTDAVLSDIKAGLIACDGAPVPMGGMFAQIMDAFAPAPEQPLKVRFDYFNIGNMGN